MYNAPLRTVEADWWDKKGDDLVQSAGTVFRVVRDENQWRTDADEYHWGLYDGTGEGGVTIRTRKNLTYDNATLPDNVCKMAADTLTAKVATIRPIPQVLTSRGNWKDQRRARKMRQFIEGAFYQHGVHEKLAPRIIKDSVVCRGGVAQVSTEGRNTKVDRVHIWTMYCDDWDAEFGEPLTMMRLHTRDRRSTVRRYGRTKDLREKIQEAGRFSSSTSIHRDEERASTVDRIELLELWHRCMEKHGDDAEKHECVGKHVLMCDGAVLFEEAWPHDFFPFAWLFYDTPNTGFFGNGLIQTLEGYQVSIDAANEKLNEQYAASGKGMLLRDGGGVVKSDVVNGLFTWHVKPGPYEPTVFDLDLVNEHMRARPVELVERALNAAGVSQMSAQSQKPTGVESGIALQTLDDVESQRHIVFGRRFESWCMEVARLLIECIKKIAKEFGDYAVQVPLKGEYLKLSWKDVVVDGFQLTMQSVGQLYMSFAGRLEKLKALFEMGAIDRGTFMRHLDAGDVQSEIDMETADKLLVDEILESMLDAEAAANDNADAPDPNYRAPHKYLPLEWAHRRAHQKRLQSEMDGAPVYVLRLLGRFIDDCDYLITQKLQAAMPPPAPPMPGGPMPPPPPGGGMPVDPMAAPMGEPMPPPMPGDVPMAA